VTIARLYEGGIWPGKDRLVPASPVVHKTCSLITFRSGVASWVGVLQKFSWKVVGLWDSDAPDEHCFPGLDVS
jgi:hypothetical protein